MLVLLASSRWRWCPGEYSLVSNRISMLYDTREYSSGHQCHLGEANKTNLLDPPFDEVSMHLMGFSDMMLPCKVEAFSEQRLQRLRNGTGFCLKAGPKDTISV